MRKEKNEEKRNENNNMKRTEMRKESKRDEAQENLRTHGEGLRYSTFFRLIHCLK